MLRFVYLDLQSRILNADRGVVLLARESSFFSEHSCAFHAGS